MKDLLLFRLLCAPELDPVAMAPLLEELARLPLPERFPFLGHLPRVLADPSPSLRAGALRVLAGATGRLAFGHLVAGLSDAEPEVRGAALEALRISSSGHGARWAHALFHPSAEVRRAAIDGPWPTGTASLTLALIPDPACGAELVRRLDLEDVAGEEPRDRPLALPPSLPALFDFADRGLIPARVVRRLVASMPWHEAGTWLRDGVRRSAAETEAVLAAAEGPEGPGAFGAGVDAFDQLFDLFWIDDAEPPDDVPLRAGFFRQLGSLLFAWPAGLIRRAVASLALVASRRRAFPAAAAGLAVVFHPRFLGFAWVPHKVRLGAVKALYAAGANAPRVPDEEVKALLAVDLCRRPNGLLDLYVIGGVLHLAENHPYNRALRWLGADAVVEAFVDDVEYAIPFLSLPDDGKRGRAYILERAARARPFARGQLLALLVVATPVTGLDFLDQVSANDAVGVLLELFKVLRRPGGEMSAKKTAAVARLAFKIAPNAASVVVVLEALLMLDSPEPLPLGVSLLAALGVAMPADKFTAVASALAAPLLLRLLATLPHASAFPYGKELALAHALVSHGDAAVSAWGRERVPPSAEIPPVVRPRTPSKAVRLSKAVLGDIASVGEARLPFAIAPCLAGPTSGLCEALARRFPPAAPSVSVCTAILGSFDPMERVDAELLRFGSADGPFLQALDAEMVRVWERVDELPPLGHAWIHRWERHAFALARALAALGLPEALARAAELSSEHLRASVWDAVASALSMWRWRDRRVLAPLCTDALGDVLASRLDSDLGDAAARSLVAIAESGVAPALVARLLPIVDARLPDMAPSTLQILSRWVASRGLVGTLVRAAPRVASAPDLLPRVRSSKDPDELEAWCAGDDRRVAEEAALRLIELGEHWLGPLLSAIVRRPPQLRALALTVPLWPEGPTLELARDLVAAQGALPELRFCLALGLLERGQTSCLEHALDAARREDAPSWFLAADWDGLVELGATERLLAIELAPSPHPHAYRPAVERLLAAPSSVEAETAGALRAFLERGTERATSLRRRAARWLKKRGDACGFPILLEEKADATAAYLGPPILDAVPAELVLSSIEAVLLVGTRTAKESLGSALLEAGWVDPAAKTAAYERLLTEVSSDASRAVALQYARHSPKRSAKLRALAETLVWGVQTGRELTGRLFRIETIAGQELGYTRLEESRIFVTPLPIVQLLPHGREIVEGLILHELGHHLYHRGEEAAEVWKTAEKEGIFGLVNLVADEHLERNLRGVDAAFGDRLKRLDAYAFQHSARDVPIVDLLESLGSRAFEVLTATPLGVARTEGCVRVGSAPLLSQMERAGLSFTRFFRALRMGLGDRHGDPVVSRALALCKGIRRRTMPGLLDLAHELRAIFGWQVKLLEHFGPHESMEGGAVEGTIHGEGITREELLAEIERVKNPARRSGASGGGAPDKPWINVSEGERFATIENVIKVARDPVEHARYANQVLGASRRMRRYLEELGVRLEPERLRVRGRRFDPSRALAVVVRGDPRMLIAREPRIRTDLFVGVVVDCSSSMIARKNIEKAKLFGAMLAEAAKGMAGVDLRLFGFTDSAIYDAGDAQHCAAHGLEPGGGNNDAAGLWHAAKAARASRRKAKLLVMISDGLPTDCSVAALRALVARLGNRHGICCAQVAVQPLAEVCFPNYVVLEEADPAPAVRRFGGIVAGLVKKAIAIA